MPRKKKSKLTRILDAIEKTLVQHAKQVVHEDNKKKIPTRKKKTTKKERPIDF
jgi:FixJ family two-component response regulator